MHIGITSGGYKDKHLSDVQIFGLLHTCPGLQRRIWRECLFDSSRSSLQVHLRRRSSRPLHCTVNHRERKSSGPHRDLNQVQYSCCNGLRPRLRSPSDGWAWSSPIGDQAGYSRWNHRTPEIKSKRLQLVIDLNVTCVSSITSPLWHSKAMETWNRRWTNSCSQDRMFIVWPWKLQNIFKLESSQWNNPILNCHFFGSNLRVRVLARH